MIGEAHLLTLAQMRRILAILQPGKWDIVEILIMATVFYLIISFVSRTRTVSLLKGLCVLALVYILANLLPLMTIRTLISELLPSIVLCIVIIFAPEMRRGLTELGKNTTFKRQKQTNAPVREIYNAVIALSEQKCGALIAIERHVGLHGYVAPSGVVIDADVSTPLLRNIFFPKSPLHDGAVLVIGRKIHAAACHVPLSTKELAQLMGTRHCAGLGLSEETDALVICVSEETGRISLFEDGRWDKDVQPSALLQRLLEAYA
ncbi:diadenylate cyclase CdaA [bacterium]|nr:diadenylate cyclase CdaA [bacterium]